MTQPSLPRAASTDATAQLQRWRERISHYQSHARALNTTKAYASALRDFTTWAAGHGLDQALPNPETVAAYLTDLAEQGAANSTLVQRRAAIKAAWRDAGLADPFAHPQVALLWEGIMRSTGAPPVRGKPLMPPLLWDVLDTIPTQRSWKNPKRPPELNLAGLRDKALLLVGFVGALRVSELLGIHAEHLSAHDNGLLLAIPRSKINQTGSQTELVVLPRGSTATRSPVHALNEWLHMAGITTGPIWRAVSTGNRILDRALHTASFTKILAACLTRAGLDPGDYSPHSLRAGFATYTHRRGASDRAITHQTRHRSLASLDAYIRHDTAWTDNAANDLGL